MRAAGAPRGGRVAGRANRKAESTCAKSMSARQPCGESRGRVVDPAEDVGGVRDRASSAGALTGGRVGSTLVDRRSREGSTRGDSHSRFSAGGGGGARAELHAQRLCFSMDRGLRAKRQASGTCATRASGSRVRSRVTPEAACSCARGSRGNPSIWRPWAGATRQVAASLLSTVAAIGARRGGAEWGICRALILSQPRIADVTRTVRWQQYAVQRNGGHERQGVLFEILGRAISLLGELVIARAHAHLSTLARTRRHVRLD